MPKIAIFWQRPLVANLNKQKWTRIWIGVTFIFGTSKLLQASKSCDRLSDFSIWLSKYLRSVITFQCLEQFGCTKYKSYSISNSGSLLFSQVGHQRALSKNCYFCHFLNLFWALEPWALTGHSPNGGLNDSWVIGDEYPVLKSKIQVTRKRPWAINPKVQICQLTKFSWFFSQTLNTFFYLQT